MIVVLASLFAALFTEFQTPSVASRPWTYWLLKNTLSDPETIEADFADIASLGFGGVLMSDSRAYHIDDNHLLCPEGTIRWGSEAWQERISVAIRAAAKHGLSFTMNVAASGGHLRGEIDAGGDNPKHLVCRRYRPGEAFEKPASPHYREIGVFAVRTAGAAPTSGWYSGGDGIISSGSSQRRRLDDGGIKACAALEARELASAAEGASLGSDWCIVRFGYDIIPNAPEDIDVLDPKAVRRHLDRAIGPLYRRVADIAGKGKTFCGIYNVSWEGLMPTWSPTFEADYTRLEGGVIRPELPLLAGFTLPGHDTAAVMRAYRHARGRMMVRNFYGTVRAWAHERGLFAFSESGGPWPRTPDIFGECDQIEFLSANDFPQGEFWPTGVPGAHPASGHANVGGRYMARGIVSAAHVNRAKYASAEAFTHMIHHWSVDPAFLKPVGDQAFADGINLMVWHTYTSSPARFGVPGLEYFAGTHINRNVTWHDEFKPFVTYLSRCQSVLQAGEPVVDILVVGDDRPYCHWSKSPNFNGEEGNERHRFVASDEAKLAIKIPFGHLNDFTSEGAYAAKRAELDARYPVVITAKEGRKLPARLKEKGITPDVIAKPGTWTWCHRRTPEGDFYFVAGEGDGKLSFRCTAPTVELWDPVDGSREAVSTTVKDGRTELKLELPMGGSVFVAFLKEKPKDPAKSRTSRSRAQALKAPWQISFAYPKGIAAKPPAPITLTELTDFTMRADLKHFSGTATYRQTFDYAGETRDAVLSLGKVPSGLAHVYLNGVDCGTVWCAPWMADVSRAIRTGANELEIRYVNNWYNRLVGDCLLPEGERVTRSNLHYWQVPRKTDPKRPWRFLPTLYSGYCPNDPLQSSGLLGPVEILAPAPASGQIVRDIPYDESLGKFGLGDLYLPQKVDASTPLVLMIHGGGWSSGGRGGMCGKAEFFRRDLGFAVFNIEYRLASAEARWPACGDDCVKAAKFVLSDAFRAKYGLQHRKIWIAGGSAGGHLTLWTLVNLPPEAVEAVVSVSSVADPQADYALHASRYDTLFGRGVKPEGLALMDPTAFVRPGLAPLLCTHAREDEVVPIASHRAFADAYAKAGNDVTFFEYPSDVIPGLTGHCIWRPCVKPHKLIAPIEEAIERFVRRVRSRD